MGKNSLEVFWRELGLWKSVVRVAGNIGLCVVMYFCGAEAMN